MLVLAIDDDPMIRKAIARIFGAQTQTVAHIEDGAVLAERMQPDVILIDASIDRRDDGIEAIPMLLRRSPQSAIIVLTGRSETQSRRAAHANGARAYIDKMHIARLREIVEDVISSDGVRRTRGRDFLH